MTPLRRTLAQRFPKLAQSEHPVADDADIVADDVPETADNDWTIQQKFLSFHAANPHVYDELVQLLRKAKARGSKRAGIRMLWEVMRWNIAMQTTSTDDADFKLNDRFTSRYARLIIKREPDIANMLETRELRAP